MQDEANIVKQYEEANVSGRIEILIKYYPNFICLVEGYEQSLSFIIKEEKAYKHRQAKEELGVRVQTSGVSDPTAREAIDNIMIMDAMNLIGCFGVVTPTAMNSGTAPPYPAVGTGECSTR